MDLKEFVGAALLQITEAVSDSQPRIRARGGYVSPSMTPYAAAGEGSTPFDTLSSGQNVFLVDFDVAVTAREGIEAGGSAKLSVASFITVSGEATSNTTSGTTSRIRFKIPLALPLDSTSILEFDETTPTEEKIRSKPLVYNLPGVV